MHKQMNELLQINGQLRERSQLWEDSLSPIPLASGEPDRPRRGLLQQFLMEQLLRFLLIGFLLISCVNVAGATEPNAAPAFVKCDPAKVLGADSCAKCHEQEVRTWQSTPHFRTFDSLHRTPRAKAIAKNLGLRSVKRNDTCVQCHYTRQQQGARVRVVAGVSCESCHGAATDWVKLHAEYGGGVTKATESAEHRQSRREQSIAAGMNNPANVYLIARQCLACHTTPEEKLVNIGGHNAGSDEFELVSWSQGMVRHNFQRTDGQQNAPSSLARVRVMYVVGALADLEASLRAVSKATSSEKFGKASAARAARLKKRVWEVQRVVNLPLLREALDAVGSLQLTIDNSEAIAAAADKVGAVAYRFAKENDGTKLDAIDSLLPPPSTYRY